MADLALIVKIVAQEGRRDDAVAALRPLVEAARDEEGTEVYAMHVQADEPDTIWFYERYTDDAARETHGRSDTMKQVGGALRGLTARRPDVTPLVPVVAKGVPGGD